LSLASALINKIIVENSLDTWANLKENYLPQELRKVYQIISKHVDNYHKLPSFEELKFEVREQSTLDKISLIEKEEVDAESIFLLDSLKSEFTAKELLLGLDKFIENSVGHSSAEETIQSIYEVISSVESKVDIVKPKDNIEKVELFDSDQELELNLTLGLNSEYDETFIFPNDSLILLGGYRGGGKSIICNNIAQYQLDAGKSVIKFSIEMSLRQELQRQCAIATGVPHIKLRYKELSVSEWDSVALWWASRYQDGYDVYKEVYCVTKDFDKFHKTLIQKPLATPVLDIVHTPTLSLAKFKAETLKRLNKYGDTVGVIIVDYLNKIRVSESSNDRFDWKDQLAVSDGLKVFAEDIGLPIISPYQVKKDGTAKFAQDILVPADAAFTLKSGENYMQFECEKMRHMEERGFISNMNWMSLKCGPESAVIISDEDNDEEENKETTQDLPW